MMDRYKCGIFVRVAQLGRIFAERSLRTCVSDRQYGRRNTCIRGTNCSGQNMIMRVGVLVIEELFSHWGCQVVDTDSHDLCNGVGDVRNSMAHGKYKYCFFDSRTIFSYKDMDPLIEFCLVLTSCIKKR